MSDTSTNRGVLNLVLEGFPAEREKELPQGEVFRLTEGNAAEALEKIFAAETVAVWAPL